MKQIILLVVVVAALAACVDGDEEDAWEDEWYPCLDLGNQVGRMVARVCGDVFGSHTNNQWIERYILPCYESLEEGEEPMVGEQPTAGDAVDCYAAMGELDECPVDAPIECRPWATRLPASPLR